MRKQRDKSLLPAGKKTTRMNRVARSSLIDIVEDTLSVFGKTQKLAGKALDKFLIIRLFQISLQRGIGLLLRLELFLKPRFLCADSVQLAVNLHDLNRHHDDQRGQHDEQNGTAAFFLGCHRPFLSGARGQAPTFS